MADFGEAIPFCDFYPRVFPTFFSYVAASAATVSGAFYFSVPHRSDFISLVRDPLEEVAKAEATGGNPDPLTWVEAGHCCYHALVSQPWCIPILLNFVICLLAIVALGVKYAVFDGHWRSGETMMLRDRSWNFLFHKLIFVFGVLGDETTDVIFLWVVWFLVVGALHGLAVITRERHVYLSSLLPGPAQRWKYNKLGVVAMTLGATAMLLMYFSIWIGFQTGNRLTWMCLLAESMLVATRAADVILRHGLYMYALWVERPAASEQPCPIWEGRTFLAYQCEVACEIAYSCIDLLHHVNMLLSAKHIISWVSMVLFLQLKHLFNEVTSRVRKHQKYTRTVRELYDRFPEATQEELTRNDDNCSICWESMSAARKLPCGHIFHTACLCSWLKQDSTCPVCRISLSNDPVRERGAPRVPTTEHTERLYQFDGSRYASWLPTFSVAFSHTQRRHIGGGRARVANNSEHLQETAAAVEAGRVSQAVSQAHLTARGSEALANPAQPLVNRRAQMLNDMARRVQDIFPHIPLSELVADLGRTGSVELTTENVLEARLSTASPPGRMEEAGTAGAGEEDWHEIGSSDEGEVSDDDGDTSDMEYGVEVDDDSIQDGDDGFNLFGGWF